MDNTEVAVVVPGGPIAMRSTRQVIGFLDIDGFECQLWQRDHPATQKKACVVIMHSGRIVSVTPEAKKAGISRSLTPRIRDAKKTHPPVIIFMKDNEYGKPDSKRTRNATYELMEAALEYCTAFPDVTVELAATDELYFNISAEVTRQVDKFNKLSKNTDGLTLEEGMIFEGRYNSQIGPCVFSPNSPQDNDPHRVAFNVHTALDEQRLVFGGLFMYNLSNFIEKKTRLTSSCGVAFNRLLAKIGCGINKPGKVTILPESGVNRIAKSVDVTSIPGLGGLCGKKLQKDLGVMTLASLRKRSINQLEAVFHPAKAAIICSWAQGEDNQPVVWKTMKEKLTINKPGYPPVRRIEVLRITVWNLTNELECLLKEELKRHGRTPVCVKLEFSLRVTIKKKKRTEIVRNHFFPFTYWKRFFGTVRVGTFRIIYGCINKNKFELVKLSFSIRDFDPPTPPRIPELRIRSRPSPVLPEVTNHRYISAFGITGNREYAPIANVQFPMLKPSSEYLYLIGSDLGSVFARGRKHDSGIVFVHDHLANYELKHACFVDWLNEFNFLAHIRSGKLQKPDFVGFSGRFSDALKTPVLEGHAKWEFYAFNVGGIIWIWEEPTPKCSSAMNPILCYNLAFEHMMRHYNDSETEPEILNEYKHSYVVTTSEFGHYRIMSVSDIDAIAEDMNLVKFDVWKSCNESPALLKSKCLKLWANNIISGVNNSVVATRNPKDGFLRSFQKFTNAEMMDNLEEAPRLCLTFGNRLLFWLKSLLKTSNRKRVLKVSWISGNVKVRCEEAKDPGNLTVPRLYSEFLDKLEGK